MECLFATDKLAIEICCEQDKLNRRAARVKRRTSKGDTFDSGVVHNPEQYPECESAMQHVPELGVAECHIYICGLKVETS